MVPPARRKNSRQDSDLKISSPVSVRTDQPKLNDSSTSRNSVTIHFRVGDVIVSMNFTGQPLPADRPLAILRSSAHIVKPPCALPTARASFSVMIAFAKIGGTAIKAHCSSHRLLPLSLVWESAGESIIPPKQLWSPARKRFRPTKFAVSLTKIEGEQFGLDQANRSEFSPTTTKCLIKRNRNCRAPPPTATNSRPPFRQNSTPRPQKWLLD